MVLDRPSYAAWMVRCLAVWKDRDTLERPPRQVRRGNEYRRELAFSGFRNSLIQASSLTVSFEPFAPRPAWRIESNLRSRSQPHLTQPSNLSHRASHKQ